MAAALPITKLASLLIKTLAKPASRSIKTQFSRYELSKHMLISIGQATNSITSRLTIMSAGYRVRNVKPLKDEDALTKGADFIGEFFLFLVGGGLVVYEYDKSNSKDILKEKERKDALDKTRKDLQNEIDELNHRISLLEEEGNDIRKMNEILQLSIQGELEKRKRRWFM